MTNCWEFLECPTERRDSCPAYPLKGSICWIVMETMCKGEKQSTFSHKRENCIDCGFLKRAQQKA